MIIIEIADWILKVGIGTFLIGVGIFFIYLVMMTVFDGLERWWGNGSD